MDWQEKESNREAKFRKRQDCWNNDIMAENASLDNFVVLLDKISDSEDKTEVEIPELISLDILRMEAQKLKLCNKIKEVDIEKLVKLMSYLEGIMADVLNEEGNLEIFDANDENEIDGVSKDMAKSRIIRSMNAAGIALAIMSSSRISKRVLMEDTIERSIQLCRQYLQFFIYPFASSSSFSGFKLIKDSEKNGKIKNNFNSFSTSILYTRIVDLMGCFSELARFQPLDEAILIQLSAISIPTFFVDNIPEIQIQSLKLVPIIFCKCPLIRNNIIADLLSSIPKIPSQKNSKSVFRLSATEFINNFTVLFLQIVQSVAEIPNRSDDVVVSNKHDQIVLDSYNEAKKVAFTFLESFLAKFKTKLDEVYRRFFEKFLNDIISTLHRPDWPMTELVLGVLARICVKNFRSEGSELCIPFRVACVEYLGIITSRLHQDRVNTSNLSLADERFLEIIRDKILEESNDPTKIVENIEIIGMSSSEKLKKLESALWDYIIGTRGNCEIFVEAIIKFYACEWYYGTLQDTNDFLADLEKTKTKEEKLKKKTRKFLQKANDIKEYILEISNKRNLKKRIFFINRTGKLISEENALLILQLLALKKDLNKSFDLFLDQILECFDSAYPIAVRAKAMRCLSQIIEVDHQILAIPKVNDIVQNRLIDLNASIREATFELIGKYLTSRADLLELYYTIMLNRIRDTAVGVRKRVIKIFCEVIENRPDLDKKPEILSRILQRINDEDTIKKLCTETFKSLWFQPINSKDLLNKKLNCITDTIEICAKEGLMEDFETLTLEIFKSNSDESTRIAAKEIVDGLVNNVLLLDFKMATEGQHKISLEKENQSRLLATLFTLSVFAKVQCELLLPHVCVFLPYLSMSYSTELEYRVINQMIKMLELIVPLVDHPAQKFLRKLDSHLCKLVKDGGMVLVASAITCISAVYMKFNKFTPSICDLFLNYLKNLSNLRKNLVENSNYQISVDEKPIILRQLYSIGLMTRYFNFDEIFTDLKNAQIYSICHWKRPRSPETGFPDGKSRRIRDEVFRILMYFSKSSISGLGEKAIISLGQLGATYSEYLNNEDLKKMYLLLLNIDRPEYYNLKVQVLKNISCFIDAETNRAIKEHEKIQNNQGIEKIDLKEMELSSSGFSSSILQVYWNVILNCYYQKEDIIRVETSQLIYQTLSRGLIMPGSSIPTLIAMSTDVLACIRSKTESLVKDIEVKYPGIIASQALSGLRMAFRLQKELQKKDSRGIIRGFRVSEFTDFTAGAMKYELKMSKEVQAALSGLYCSIRNNKQRRRNFLGSLLRLFSDNQKAPLDLDELIFVADNLALFPYSQVDEPLFVMHQIDAIVSISGQNVLSSFKKLLSKIPTKISTDGAMDVEKVEDSDEEDDLKAEYIYNHFPREMRPLYELKKTSQACFILLQLKFYLIKFYGFQKEKLDDYNPTDSSKEFERPASRRNIPLFSPESAIAELNRNKDVDEDLEFKLAKHFQNFFRMLLSLDELEESFGELI